MGGDQYEEVFEFKTLGGTPNGTASYLNARLAIEHASLDLSDHRQLSCRDHAGATTRPFDQHAVLCLGHDVAVSALDRTAPDMVDPLTGFEGGLGKYRFDEK